MTPELSKLRRLSDSHHREHARACHKPPTDCKRCKQMIDWYASIPLPQLAIVLEDKPVRKGF